MLSKTFLRTVSVAIVVFHPLPGSIYLGF